jgi:cytochrome b6-f complex iron-sulfur subunit
VLPAVPAGLAAGVSAAVAGGCAGASYLVPVVSAGALVVPLAALEPTGSVFVAHPRSNRPVYVARTGPEAYVALHARCTHKGCQPEPVAGRLVCPCHGSEFALDGSVLEGPAERRLTRYPVAVVGRDVHVRIDGGA